MSSCLSIVAPIMYGPLHTTASTQPQEATGIDNFSSCTLEQFFLSKHPPTTVTSPRSHPPGLWQREPYPSTSASITTSASTQTAPSFSLVRSDTVEPAFFAPSFATPSEPLDRLPNFDHSSYALNDSFHCLEPSLPYLINHSAIKHERHEALSALSLVHDKIDFDIPPCPHTKRRAISNFDISAVSVLPGHIPSNYSADGTVSEQFEATIPTHLGIRAIPVQSMCKHNEDFNSARNPGLPKSDNQRFLGHEPCPLRADQSFAIEPIRQSSNRGEIINPELRLGLGSPIPLHGRTAYNNARGNSDGSLGKGFRSEQARHLSYRADLLRTPEQDLTRHPDVAPRDHSQASACFWSSRTSLTDLSSAQIVSAATAKFAPGSIPTSTPLTGNLPCSTALGPPCPSSAPPSPSYDTGCSGLGEQSSFTLPLMPPSNFMLANVDTYHKPPLASALHRSSRLSPASLKLTEAGDRPYTSPPLVVSSADRLHVCRCGKRFKRAEHLKRHNHIHTHERPHKCPHEICEKTFSRPDNLAQHVKTHRHRSLN